MMFHTKIPKPTEAVIEVWGDLLVERPVSTRNLHGILSQPIRKTSLAISHGRLRVLVVQLIVAKHGVILFSFIPVNRNLL